MHAGVNSFLQRDSQNKVWDPKWLKWLVRHMKQLMRDFKAEPAQGLLDNRSQSHILIGLTLSAVADSHTV